MFLLWCLVVVLIYVFVLYFLQDTLIFLPDKRYKSPKKSNLTAFSEVVMTSFDGLPIMTWYHKGQLEKPAILFLHGITGQIATFAPHLLPLVDEGYTVFAPEYRSFGGTKGHPRQNDVIKDIQQAFDWLKQQGYQHIIVYGYSFGTAFASALAASRPIDALILTSPYSSLEKLVSEKPVPFAKFLLKDKYLSYKYLEDYKGPLLIIHGKKDRLIPCRHAQILYDCAGTTDKKLILLDESNHNGIFFKEENIAAIKEFLNRF